MLLEHYRPRPKLVTKTTLVLHPRYPVVDAHNHLADPFGGGWDKKPLTQLLDILDEAGVRVYVDLGMAVGAKTSLTPILTSSKPVLPNAFVSSGVWIGANGLNWATAFPDWAARKPTRPKRTGGRRAQDMEAVWPTSTRPRRKVGKSR